MTTANLTTAPRRTTIAERVTGHRTICGTDFAVTDKITREQLGTPRRRPIWVLTVGICNGVAECSTEFRTLRAALAAWEV